jgi:tetraacyldisaccharide 4'-kinase
MGCAQSTDRDLMRVSWLESDRESSTLRAALLPLDAVSWVYATGARLHRVAYQRGLCAPRRLSCKVVSVGNLVVGGSGKTPTAAWVARELRGRGHRVALASRGYGRRSRERVLLVSDGEYVRCGSREAGDEPLLLAAHAPGVPVLVGRDRAVVGLRAVSTFGSEVLVLDDGFQHHRLARDVEILTVDGVAGFGNRRVLPRGPLREPLAALRLADAIGVVDGPLRPEDADLLRVHAPSALCFDARREPTALRPIRGGASEPCEILAGARVGLLAGIAGPDSFRRTLERLGASVVAERRYPDHHRYRAADLRGLEREAPLWVTTEKDAVKILPSWIDGSDVRVLRVELAVQDAERLLDWLDVRLR